MPARLSPKSRPARRRRGSDPNRVLAEVRRLHGNKEHRWFQPIAKLDAPRLLGWFMDDLALPDTLGVRHCLMVSLANLVDARSTRRQVALTLNANCFAAKAPKDRRTARRKRPVYPFRLSDLVTVLDALEDHGYIERKVGYFNHEHGRGKCTRIWPTWRFDFATDHVPNTAPDFGPSDIIVLRDADGNDKVYRDDEFTVALREKMAAPDPSCPKKCWEKPELPVRTLRTSL